MRYVDYMSAYNAKLDEAYETRSIDYAENRVRTIGYSSQLFGLRVPSLDRDQRRVTQFACVPRENFLDNDPLLKYHARQPTHNESVSIYHALKKLDGYPGLLIPTWKIADTDAFPLAYAYGEYGVLGRAFFASPYAEYLDLALAWVSAWLNLSEQGIQLSQDDYELRTDFTKKLGQFDNFWSGFSCLRFPDVNGNFDEKEEKTCAFLCAAFGAWLTPKARFLAAPFYYGRELPYIITNEGLSKPLTRTDFLRPSPVTILQGGGIDYSEFTYTKKRPGRRTVSSVSDSQSNTATNSNSTSVSRGRSTAGGEHTTGNPFGHDASYRSSDVTSNTQGVSRGHREDTSSGRTQSKSNSDVVLDEEMKGRQGLLTYLEDLVQFLDHQTNLSLQSDFVVDDAHRDYCKQCFPNLAEINTKIAFNSKYFREAGYKEDYQLSAVYEAMCKTAKSQVGFHSEIDHLARLHRHLLAWVDAYTAYALGYQRKLIEFLERFSLPDQPANEERFRFYNPKSVRIDAIQRFDRSTIHTFTAWIGME